MAVSPLAQSYPRKDSSAGASTFALARSRPHVVITNRIYISNYQASQ